jgi:hypothetical protein
MAGRADDADLAKKVANPVSDLISVPFQFNYDCCFGPANGGRFTLNIQPVVPVKLNENWTLVIRTILPVIQQWEMVPGGGNHFGLGDTTQSFFFVPSNLGNGLIFGAGPVFLWPTGTDPVLRSEKWGAGPTAVIARQEHGWTYGVLANHIWSYTGSSIDHRDVNATFLQPFISYTFPDTTSVTVNTESSYDWVAQQWTVPINVGVSHIFKFGDQPVSLGVQGRYYAVTPPYGPTWGARFNATFLFPG